jgi:hypothetical protein
MLRLAMLDSGAALRDRALARIGALGAPAAPGTGSEPDEPESLSAPSGRAS